MAVFNEVNTIAIAVDSIFDVVDVVVIVDGSWANVLEPSSDGTLEEIRRYSKEYNKIKLIEAKKWNWEADKREEYLIGQEGDIYFILDGDEKLLCGAEWLKIIQTPEFLQSHPNDRSFNALIWNRDEPNTFHQRVYHHFSYKKRPEARMPLPIVIEHLDYLNPRKTKT